MSTIRIGPKHQVTIPKAAFQKLQLGVGDILEAEVQQGKLVLVPKMLMDRAPIPKLTAKERKLLTRVRLKISAMRRDLVSSRGLTTAEADIAARVGLIAEDQRWWWTEQWQKGEREAERDLLAGRSKRLETAKELIEELHSK